MLAQKKKSRNTFTDLETGANIVIISQRLYLPKHRVLHITDAQ